MWCVRCLYVLFPVCKTKQLGFNTKGNAAEVSHKCNTVKYTAFGGVQATQACGSGTSAGKSANLHSLLLNYAQRDKSHPVSLQATAVCCSEDS